jgi:hypothetical protein
LDNAIDWYDEKRTGLGDEFAHEYWAAIERIENQPLTYAVNETGLRACRLARFPYVVHYRCSELEVIIVAVMFGGRDTSAWNDRV